MLNLQIKSSVKNSQSGCLAALTNLLKLQEVTLALRDGQISMKETSERLSITIQTDSLQVIQDGNELKATRKSINPGYSTTWRESSHMAIGGLLGGIILMCIVLQEYLYNT